MTSLYTLGALELSGADAAFVADFRRRHEPRHGEHVPAHFTLVFAGEPRDQDAEFEYQRHVTSVAESFAPIEFVLRSARVEIEASDGLAYVFLVPDEGSRELGELHARLHTGSLAPLWRADRPYRPHVTVATTSDRAVAESLCRELAARDLAIEGSIHELRVCSVPRGPVVHAIARLGDDPAPTFDSVGATLDHDERREFPWDALDEQVWMWIASHARQPATQLPRRVARWFACRNVEWDVSNGGFAQAAFNVPELFPLAAEGYRALGRDGCAQLIDDATRVLARERRTLERKGLFSKAIGAVFEHFESSRMAEFDERIVPWEWEAGLARSAYIRRHREDFRALDER